MLTRRHFAAVSATALLAALGVGGRFASAESKKKTFPLTLTDAEWKSRLSAEQFYVLRKHGTERPFSSPLDKTYAEGTYACAGCDKPLFTAATKYDSRTGWPSFYAPIENAVGTTTDWLIGYPRTEVHCAHCGGHLGHVFDDGPKPTGKRYCMNGVAMKFVPKSSS